MFSQVKIVKTIFGIISIILVLVCIGLECYAMHLENNKSNIVISQSNEESKKEELDRIQEYIKKAEEIKIISLNIFKVSLVFMALSICFFIAQMILRKKRIQKK